MYGTYLQLCPCDSVVTFVMKNPLALVHLSLVAKITYLCFHKQEDFRVDFFVNAIKIKWDYADLFFTS